MRLSSQLANLIIFGISTTLSLLCVEAVLRWRGLRAPETGRLAAYEFDEVLGWRTRKNFRRYRSTPYYAHFNYYDSDGFPCAKDRCSVPLDRSVPSLALIGDSFAEGYYLPAEDGPAEQIRRETKIGQVVNLGVSGYAPDQYLLNARRNLPNFNVVAIVVLFFPYNDTFDVLNAEYQGYAKPYFTDDSFEPANTPLIKIVPHVEESSALKAMLKHSAIYSALRPFVRRWFLPGNNASDAARYDSAGFHKALTLINRIREEFPVPYFLVFYIPHFREVEREAIWRENYKLFLSLCKGFGIKCISFFDEWERFSADSRSLFIAGDGHLSAHGVKAMAEEIGKVMDLSRLK